MTFTPLGTVTLRHMVLNAGRKQNDVAQEMAKTLKRLEEKKVGISLCSTNFYGK